MIETFYNILHWMALHPVYAFFIVLAEFIVIMKIHHKAHNEILHKILGLLFAPQNFIVNVIPISIIGLELPQEYTTTARMKRWKKQEPTQSKLNSWRYNFAAKLCDTLNKYDTGHC